MKPWAKHVVLTLKAKRERHVHWWRRLEGLNGTEWHCDSCPKRITENEVVRAGRGSLYEMFEPVHPDQLRGIQVGAMFLR